MAEAKVKARYIESVGRRKTSVARARLEEAAKQSIVVNDKEVFEYFKTKDQQHIIEEAFLKAEIPTKFKVSIKVQGGGASSQSVAVRHAISRALVEHDRELRKPLKAAGFLKRDPRAKERRKFGLKKARKAPQWSKR
jgi:small subunit ribosomal protein S9